MAKKLSSTQSLPETKHRATKKASIDKATAAKAAIDAMGQALRKAALYLHQQDGLEDFFQPMLKELQAYQEKFGGLTLVIKPFDFFYDGESVYRAQNQGNSITYKLYRGGIRSLTFERGVMAQDLASLGRLLLKTPIELQEEDLASLLWREGIPHISYLQITSAEEEEDEEGTNAEGDNVEELLVYLNQKFAKGDSRHKVNFRSFSAADLAMDSFLSKTKTHRQLFESPKASSAGETSYIREIVTREESSMITKGGELLFFLCKHAQHADELNEVQETFEHLVECLFVTQDFGHLGRLLDAIQRLTTAARVQGAKGFIALKRALFQMFLEPERFQALLDYLNSVGSLPEDERNDLCAFLCLLGPPMSELLQQTLASVQGLTRRVFLMALMIVSDNPQELNLRLLEEYDKDKEFLLDMLYVGQVIPRIFSRQKLESMLEDSDPQTQQQALVLFLYQYPDEVLDMGGGLFKNAGSGVLRSLFEVLCQNDPHQGVEKLFGFVKSKGFTRLADEDQAALYIVLGRSQRKEFLDWFDQLLERKSRFWRPGVDREKRLALRGIEAFGSFTAQAILKKHTQQPYHSTRLRDELAHSLTFYHLYLRATKAPTPKTPKHMELHK